MGFLTSSPLSRRHGTATIKRRNTSVLTVLLLLLSHNVWNTLQCGTSSTRPRPLASAVQSGEDGDVYDNRLSSSHEFLVGSSGRTVFVSNGNNDPNVEKKDAEGDIAQPERYVQICHGRLLAEVQKVCGSNNFFAPTFESNTAQGRQASSLHEVLGASKRSIMQRRLTRSLANECCKRPCNRTKLETYCKDKSNLQRDLSLEQELEPEPTQVTIEREDSTEVDIVEDPNTRLQSSREEPEADPAIYYPIFHFLKFMHRQFGNRHSNSRPTNTIIIEENEPSTLESDLPIPQARVQQEPSRADQRHRSKDIQGFNGNRAMVTGSNVGGKSFTNTDAVASQRQGYTNHRQHHHASAANTGGGDVLASYDFANQLPHIPITHHFNHHQGQGRQMPRRPSTNILTSTIAPHIPIIRLDPSTDDEV